MEDFKKDLMTIFTLGMKCTVELHTMQELLDGTMSDEEMDEFLSGGVDAICKDAEKNFTKAILKALNKE